RLPALGAASARPRPEACARQRRRLLRLAAGRAKMSAMSVGLQFSRVRAAGETQWHVHRAGRFIGSIVERGGALQASRMVDGEVRSEHFADRDAAAAWLAKLAGG